MKVAKRKQLGMVGEVTEKDFTVANKKRKIFKDITTFCVHTKKTGSP